MNEGEGGDAAGAHGWRAWLCAELALRGGRSMVERARHEGPLRLSRSFYPEGPATCHLYVLHPPAGVVGGDRLELSIRAGRDCGALVTTPGATKLYRSQGQTAELVQDFVVASGACLEWLPQETIAFDGARARVHTRLTLARDACAALWEIVCLGRPAAGERFEHGELRLSCEIAREGELCFVERAHYRGGDPLLEAPFGLAGEPVLGTFVVALREPLGDAELERLRGALEVEAGLCAATALSSLVVVRYRGRSTRVARAAFERAFRVLRPLYARKQAVRPRIWNT